MTGVSYYVSVVSSLKHCPLILHKYLNQYSIQGDNKITFFLHAFKVFFQINKFPNIAITCKAKQIGCGYCLQSELFLSHPVEEQHPAPVSWVLSVYCQREYWVYHCVNHCDHHCPRTQCLVTDQVTGNRHILLRTPLSSNWNIQTKLFPNYFPIMVNCGPASLCL